MVEQTWYLSPNLVASTANPGTLTDIFKESMAYDKRKLPNKLFSLHEPCNIQVKLHCGVLMYSGTFG